MSDHVAAFGGRRIGPHLQILNGLRKVAQRAEEIGAAAVQIFTDNPTAWRRRGAPPEELPDFVERLARADIAPLAIHGPYLVNLAGPDRDFWDKSVATVVHEMETGALYGAGYVNFHVGSHRGSTAEEGIARVAAGLAVVLEQLPDTPDVPVLVLENSAGGGDGIGSTVADLALILEGAVRAGVEERRVGFCLDVAHLWGAGHDVGTVEGVEALLDDFDDRIGLARLAMIHLNDSRAALGSRADRHEHIGAGQIGHAGLRHLLTAARLAHVPAFIETPGMDLGYDRINLQRIRMLIAGEPLPTLPPEAFQARSSKSPNAAAARAAAAATPSA